MFKGIKKKRKKRQRQEDTISHPGQFKPMFLYLTELHRPISIFQNSLVFRGFTLVFWLEKTLPQEIKAKWRHGEELMEKKIFEAQDISTSFG